MFCQWGKISRNLLNMCHCWDDVVMLECGPLFTTDVLHFTFTSGESNCSLANSRRGDVFMESSSGAGFVVQLQ